MILAKFKNVNENNFRQNLDPEIQSYIEIKISKLIKVILKLRSLKNLENMPLVAAVRPKKPLGSSQTVMKNKD
jgi:hypothetical protein